MVTVFVFCFIYNLVNIHFFDKYENVYCIFMAFNFNDIKTDNNRATNIITNGVSDLFLESASPFEILNALTHQSLYCRGFQQDENPWGYKNYFWINKAAGTEPRKYMSMLMDVTEFWKPDIMINFVASIMYESTNTNFCETYENNWNSILENHYSTFKYRIEKSLGIKSVLFEMLTSDETKKIYDYYRQIVNDFQNSGLGQKYMELLHYYSNREEPNEFPTHEIYFSKDNGMYILLVNDIRHRSYQVKQRKPGYPNIHFSFTGLKSYLEFYNEIQDNGETALKKYNDLVNKKILKPYGLKVPPEYFAHHEEETDEYYQFYVEYTGAYRFSDSMSRIYLVP